MDNYYSDSRPADDCPEIGWTSAWFLHGKGEKMYFAGSGYCFKPNNDGTYDYGRGPIKEMVIKGIKDIDDQIERNRRR